MLQHFAAVASYAELQMYPVSAKYHLSLCGVPIRTDSRVKDCRDFTELRQIETRSLLGLLQDYQRLLPDQQ